MRVEKGVWPGVVVSLLLFGIALLVLWVLLEQTQGVALVGLDTSLQGLLLFTLYQALLSTLLSVVFGFLLAWSLAYQPRFVGRDLLIALFSSSLVLPTLVVVLGLIGVYGREGWLNQLWRLCFHTDFGSYLYGLFGILLAHTYLNASYASRAFLTALASIPPQKHKLSMSLGFGILKRFWYVEYPALKGVVLSTATTIFMLCFTSFAIVLILGGNPRFNTLEVALYEAIRLDFDIPRALEIAWVQLLVATVLVTIANRMKSSVSNLKPQSTLMRWPQPWGVVWFQRSFIVLFGLFFLLPLMATVVDGLQAPLLEIVQRPIFLRALLTSLAVATLSALLTVAAALALSVAKCHFTLPTRMGDCRISGWVEGFLSLTGNLYLMIPSLVLGLGFFLLSLHSLLPKHFWATVALVVANVLLALPFALSLLYEQLYKVAVRYDKLCLSLGIKGWQRFKLVEFPYIKGVVGYIFALSFAFSLGDLGVIALFGSDAFITLPWYLYGLMGSYQTKDAAGVALVMLLLIWALFWLIPKYIGGSNATDR